MLTRDELFEIATQLGDVFAMVPPRTSHRSETQRIRHLTEDDLNAIHAILHEWFGEEDPGDPDEPDEPDGPGVFTLNHSLLDGPDLLA